MLVLGQFADLDPREAALLALEQHGGFLRLLANAGRLGLLGIERLEDLVGRLGLVVVELLLGVGEPVAVDNRSAESRSLDTVAIGPQRQVPTGQFELEPALARLAEQRDVVLLEAAIVVFHLLHHAIVAIFAHHAADDLVNQDPLLGGKEIVANRRLGDRPVGADLLAERMIESEGDHLLLSIGERSVELRRGGLGGTLG